MLAGSGVIGETSFSYLMRVFNQSAQSTESISCPPKCLITRTHVQVNVSLDNQLPSLTGMLDCDAQVSFVPEKASNCDE